MVFGLNEQHISGYSFTDEGLVVEGTGFNIDSQLFIDQKRVETQFVNETKLLVKMEPREFSCLSLKQLSRRQEVLGEEIKLTRKD